MTSPQATWELWTKEWQNAYNFFNSKGNVKTKSRLKNKWHKDFMNIIEEISK